MSQDNSLIFPAAIDLASLDRDIASAESMVDGFASSAASKLGNIPVAKLTVEGTTDATSMAAAFLPMAGTIKGALSSAVQPLTAFAADFHAKFDEVGATVEKLSVRIDDAMRFPQFLKRVDAFRRAFLSRFNLTMQEAGEEAKKSLMVEADASKLVGSYGRARDKIKKTVAPIPGDVGYALEKAVHVDAKASFKSYLAGLDEVKSAAVNKMKAMADAVENATGKGSRKGRWKARDNAADLGQRLKSVPSRQMVTAPTTVPDPTIWQRMGQAANIAGTIAQKTHLVLSKAAQQDARDIDRVIATWRKFKQIQSTVSTFGSVAKASFGPLAKLPVPKLKFDAGQSVVLKGIGSAAREAGGGLASMASQASMALGIFNVAFKVVDFFRQGAKGASDLNETMNRVDVTLGTGAGKVKTFADTMARDFGMAKGQTLDMASAFGGLGKSLGRLSGDKLASFSVGMTKLSADLSSFANIDAASAAEAIQTGLAGNQSDKLKELGVILTEDTVKQYAYANGIAAAGDELNEQQKFMARSALITKGLAKVQGDLERTGGGAANQGRKLMGTVQNLGVTIGGVILPVLTEGIKLLNEFGSWALKTFEDNKATVESWGETLLGAFDYVVAAVHNFPAAFDVARIKVAEILTNIGEYISVLGPNAVIVADYIAKNWLLLIGDAFDATLTALKNLWTNFQSIGQAIFDWLKDPTKGFTPNWTPLLDGFRATADKFPDLIKPALTDMSKEIAEAAQPIEMEVAQRRAKRMAEKNTAQGPLVDTPIADEALKGKEKGKKDKKDNDLKFAGALELGSSEAYSSIVSATSGRSKGMDQLNKSAQNTADNTGRIAQILGGAREVRRPGRLVIS